MHVEFKGEGAHSNLFNEFPNGTQNNNFHGSTNSTLDSSTTRDANNRVIGNFMYNDSGSGLTRGSHSSTNTNTTTLANNNNNKNNNNTRLGTHRELSNAPLPYHTPHGANRLTGPHNEALLAGGFPSPIESNTSTLAGSQPPEEEIGENNTDASQRELYRDPYSPYQPRNPNSQSSYRAPSASGVESNMSSPYRLYPNSPYENEYTPHDSQRLNHPASNFDYSHQYQPSQQPPLYRNPNPWGTPPTQSPHSNPQQLWNKDPLWNPSHNDRNVESASVPPKFNAPAIFSADVNGGSYSHQYHHHQQMYQSDLYSGAQPPYPHSQQPWVKSGYSASVPTNLNVAANGPLPVMDIDGAVDIRLQRW